MRPRTAAKTCMIYSLGPPMESVVCVVCQVDDRERRLGKCPICFKLVCENCAHRTMGRDFCSKRCADQFFFGADDE